MIHIVVQMEKDLDILSNNFVSRIRDVVVIM